MRGHSDEHRAAKQHGLEPQSVNPRVGDSAGRVPGAVVCELDEALNFIQDLEEEEDS